MPYWVLRQFLWELKAGVSEDRVAKEKELTALNLVGNSTLGIGASSGRRRGIDGSKVVLSSLHCIVVAINARPGHTPRRCCAGSPNDRCEREPETHTNREHLYMYLTKQSADALTESTHTLLSLVCLGSANR